MNNINKELLKALKGNQKSIEIVKEKGYTVTWDDMSEQGYPSIVKNGVHVVISKDYSDRTRLFAGFESLADFKSMKHVDIENVFKLRDKRKKQKMKNDRLERFSSKLIDYRNYKWNIEYHEEQKAKLLEKLEYMNNEIDIYKKAKNELF